MPFELVAPSIRQVIRRQYLTDVTIHRYLYQHSWARLVIDWDEGWREGDKHRNGLRPTTQIGASLLNAEVAIRWRGKDLASQVDCFRGYVARVSARHTTTRSFLVLECISHSKRTDLIPRYRVWQDCTLLDICQHIASREPLIQIAPEAQSVLGDITIQLSVQYGETDFAYLSRMMHAWGIPLAVDDRAGKVIIGSPQIASSGTFPELNWHWRTLALEGHLVPLDSKARSASAGTLGIAKLQVNQFNQSLSRIASDYFPKLDEEHQEELIEITDRMYDNIYASDTVFYRLEWEGYVYDYSPGNIVQWGGQPLLIRACFIHGDHRADSATQTFILQDHLAPVQPHKRRVNWPSRTLWARVVKNNDEDPTKSGRVQVEFDWEKLDPTSKGQNRCWLPTLTPYGGLKGKSGTSGFLSLPEVGEHVLVQFLDEWDSDAVVIGSVREYPREGFVYDPHETKRWQTPSGNQVTMTTTDGGKTDIVRLKCRDKMVFEARITADKEIVILDLCDSDNDRIHFQKGGGPTRLDIFCSEEIYIHAGQKLYIEGGQIQITSKSGGLNLKSAANIEIQGMTIDVDGSSGVNIDGAVVKLNCPPAVPHKHWSLQPLKKERDQKSEGGETKKKRAKRARWAAAAPSSALFSAAQTGSTLGKAPIKAETPIPSKKGTKGRAGKVRHTDPKTADTLIRTYLKPYVKNAVAAGKKIEGFAQIVGEPDWSKAGEAHYGKDEWKTKKDLLNGFVDKNGKVWIHKDRGNPATMIHEGVHKYAADALIKSSQPLNEGVTEYFTRLVADKANLAKGRRNYQQNYECAKALAELAGEEALAKAYFDGDIDQLKNTVDNKLGNGKWEEFVKATRSEDWEKATNLLKSR
jgi:hypothetical protein